MDLKVPKEKTCLYVTPCEEMCRDICICLLRVIVFLPYFPHVSMGSWLHRCVKEIACLAAWRWWQCYCSATGGLQVLNPGSF